MEARDLSVFQIVKDILEFENKMSKSSKPHFLNDRNSREMEIAIRTRKHHIKNILKVCKLCLTPFLCEIFAVFDLTKVPIFQRTLTDPRTDRD